MGAKGSKISRTVQYFREVELDEARVAFTLVQEVVTNRLKRAADAAKSQTRAAATPRKQRRTKAQMAQDASAGTDSPSAAASHETLANA